MFINALIDYFSFVYPVIRIINDSPNSALFNMAADQYLMQKCLDFPIIYLRFYKWNPPSISLGYRENPAETLNFSAMEKHNISWIRRPTGGRCILHFHDITYSIVFSRKITRMGKSISHTYRIISHCLIDGLKYCAIDPETHNSQLNLEQERGHIKLPCFLAPNRDEIMVNGKKLIGSAQKRTSHAVLQHGSIPVTNAYQQLPDYLKITQTQRKTQKRMLSNKCTYLRKLNSELDEKDIVMNLIKGFTKNLPFDSKRKMWTSQEKRTITEIAGSNRFISQWQTIPESIGT